jgi:hypothetical protein
MGLRNEAFFILEGKGGDPYQESAALAKASGLCRAHKERKNGNVFCGQTQGPFRKRT